MDKEDFIEEVYNVLTQDLHWLSDMDLDGDQIQDILVTCSSLIYHHTLKRTLDE